MKKEIKINNSYTFKTTQILLKDLLNIIDVKKLYITSESNDFTPFELNLYLYKNNVLDGVEHWQIKNSFKLDAIKDMYYVHEIFIMNRDCLSVIVSQEKPLKFVTLNAIYKRPQENNLDFLNATIGELEHPSVDFLKEEENTLN